MSPAAAPGAATTFDGVRADLVFVPDGRFMMGSDLHYPEEALARPVAVDGFFIDSWPVTNK
jgi:formylglycine-generating enzyme required for sulfatase activity